MYEFLNSTNANDFERFVLSQNGSFTQSLAWANVKANWDSEGVLSRDEKGSVRGACLVLIKKVPLIRSALLYAPRGPVYSDEWALSELMEGIGALADKKRAFAFICDPPVIDDSQLRSAGFSRKITGEERTIQCRSNYILDLEGKTLSEIRSEFKPEYRNRIGKAQRRGVWCEEFHAENAPGALDDFYALMVQTGRRDGFPIRPREYFARLLSALGEHARLYMCYTELGGKTPLSGAVAVEYGGNFGYVYGASSDDWRNLYPSYLMQWTMICKAFELGCRVYDFGGVPFYNDETRREYGMYRFKKGFGGEVVEYAGQFVKVYRPALYRTAAIFSGALR